MVKHIKVLIVDGEENGSAMLEQKALEKGLTACSTEVITSGKECLRRLGEQPYDAILLDYVLPDTDGLHLLRDMKQAGLGTPVVLLATAGYEDSMAEAMTVGAYGYVSKDDNLGYIKVLPSVVERCIICKEMEAGVKAAHEQSEELEWLRTANQTTIHLNHEINNPLMVILGSVQILLMNADQFAEKTAEKLRTIEQCTIRIGDLSRQLSKANKRPGATSPSWIVPNG